MKSRQRRSFSAEMKARIALEAIKGQKTIQEIASHYGVHPSQVTNWTMKYEEVYLKDYLDVLEAVANLKRYFTFYNHERLHQALDYQTPGAIYFGRGGCTGEDQNGGMLRIDRVGARRS